MSQIARLKEVEIANGNLINADDLNAEYDQLVLESNAQDSRLTAIESGALTITGVKTFNTPPRMNKLDEAMSDAGVRVDGVQCRDGSVNPRAIITTIASVDITTDQITTAAPHHLSTGDTVGFAPATADGVLPGGLEETALYYARVISPSIVTLHPSQMDALFVVNTIDLTSTGSGEINVIGEPGAPKPGDIWVNQEGALRFQSLENAYTIMDGQGWALSPYENRTAVPVYTSSTTFTLNYLGVRDWANVRNITYDAPITVDVATPFLNGVVQFDTVGTVSVTNGTNTVSVTSGEGGFVIGDVLVTNGGQVRRVTAVDGDGNPTQVHVNWSSTETGVSFKQGGRCANTWYYLYATISFGVTGLYLSTRNHAGGQDIDFATEAFRQLPFAIRLDGSGNIIPFFVETGWPYRPKILYQVAFPPVTSTPGPTNVLDGGTSSSYIDLDLSNFVPKISRQAVMLVKMFHTSSASVYVRQNGTTADGWAISTNPSSQIMLHAWTIPTDANQLIEYKISGGSTDIDVMGYVVTEV